MGTPLTKVEIRELNKQDSPASEGTLGTPLIDVENQQERFSLIKGFGPPAHRELNKRDSHATEGALGTLLNKVRIQEGTFLAVTGPCPLLYSSGIIVTPHTWWNFSHPKQDAADAFLAARLIF